MFIRNICRTSVIAVIAMICLCSFAKGQELGTVRGEIQAEMLTSSTFSPKKYPGKILLPGDLAKLIVRHKPTSGVLQKYDIELNKANRAKLKTLPGHYVIRFDEARFPFIIEDQEQRDVILVDNDGNDIYAESARLAALAHGELTQIVSGGPGYFSAFLSEAGVRKLRVSPGVASVDADGIGELHVASWGLDRINQRATVGDNLVGNNATGIGVHIYIFDTGIKATHVDLAGSIGNGYSPLSISTSIDHGYNDGGIMVYHGTHVAGTAAGTNYGVATGATLHPVCLTNSSGSFVSNIQLIACANWIKNDHLYTNIGPAVVNCSWGASYDASLETAFTDLIAAGVTVVASAGNHPVTTPRRESYVVTIPAMVDGVIGVGSLDQSDTRSLFSMVGAKVDLWAPGESIKSANGDPLAGTSDTETWDGTSMAAPHVAGIAALYLQRYQNAGPAEVQGSLLANATRAAIVDLEPVGWIPPLLGNPGYWHTFVGANNAIAYAGNEWLDSDVVIVGGNASLASTNTLHPNGVTYDQVLLNSSSVTAKADPGQVTRISWIDENDDILMAEFAGSGTLTVTLEGFSGPAAPIKYNQPSVSYGKGRAMLKVLGSSPNTYLAVFSLGAANMVNTSILMPVSYNGIADIKQLIVGRTGNLGYIDRIGGLYMGNVNFVGSTGFVGIVGDNDNVYIQVDGRLALHNIFASGSADPVLCIDYLNVTGPDGGIPIIAGGNLVQGNSKRIRTFSYFQSWPGFPSLHTSGNADSHGNFIPPSSLASAPFCKWSQTNPIVYTYDCINAGGFPVPSGSTAP